MANVEIIKCGKCGKEYDAYCEDLGTYVCSCRANKISEKKKFDEAIKKLADEYPKQATNEVRDKEPGQ